MGTDVYNVADMFGGKVLNDNGFPKTTEEKRAKLREASEEFNSRPIEDIRSRVMGRIEFQDKINIQGGVNMENEWKSQISLKIGGHMLNVRDTDDRELVKRLAMLISDIEKALPYIAKLEEDYTEAKNTSYTEDEDEVPGSDTIEPVKKSAKSSLNDLACEKCGGECWDNRKDKKNPKAPDWRCKDPQCNMVAWVRGGKVSWEKGLPRRVG